MGEQRFSKVKKTVIILLAVFLVISLTAASASAWYSKTSSDKCKSNLHEKVVKEKMGKEKVVKEVAKEKVVKEVAKEKVVKKVAKEKVVKEVAKEKVVKEVAKEKVVKEVAREKVDNRVFRDDFREKFKIKYFNIRGCVAGCRDNGFDGWWDY